ncbi:unnamed protein product [Cyberlindnera jadinii]|uniref:Cyclin-domain-containing protein n=1 Tax=Cyberlindnera jadinii (strain ATCC 18201 / CBS 1600 / BCRC 20928 / JCM 3617 / NBRC 0987 / NRRL Y-1542) TaxID=983966 RepID=A0A0H5CIN4_CYBJN|nr:cyclin-domain-containing protein [Cyberlindnera jadinii NRRL Y-1542]ODV73215.1 cyclin-domain-containing protein [Cyberlindnera jadinii NRRL Y-1542]CEP24414.1 unnamed protein product [Cyberlindnera jadinii]
MDDIPLRIRTTETFVDAPQPQQPQHQEQQHQEQQQHSRPASPMAPPACPKLDQVDISEALNNNDNKTLDVNALEPLTALALLDSLIKRLMDLKDETELVIESNCSEASQDEEEEENPLSPKKRRWSDEGSETLVIGEHEAVLSEEPSPSSELGQRQRLAKRFDLKFDPNISATSYLERIHQYCQFSTATYLATAYYIHRVAVELKLVKLTNLNVHRLIIAAIRISCKTLEDINHRQLFIAKMGGVNAKDLLSLEITLLFLIKFECQVNESTLAQTITNVKRLLNP